MHVVSICLHYGNIIWLPWQRLLTNWKIRYRFIIGTKSAFIWWKVNPEIFDEIRQTTTWTRNAILIRMFFAETTVPTFTKILHDIVAIGTLFTVIMNIYGVISFRFWIPEWSPTFLSIRSGVWEFSPPKFCYLHRIGWLILQQCKHYRATLWCAVTVKNRNISQTVWPVSMKCCTMAYIIPPQLSYQLIKK